MGGNGRLANVAAGAGATHGSPSPGRQLPILISLELALLRRLAHDASRRARRLAQRRAIARFARIHPIWFESLFDSNLLRSLPEDFSKRDPASVARSWTLQFPYGNEARRERDVERLEPVARDFLQVLAEEESRLESVARA
jgi:hypothetical protein